MIISIQQDIRKRSYQPFQGFTESSSKCFSRSGSTSRRIFTRFMVNITQMIEGDLPKRTERLGQGMGTTLPK